VDRFEVVYARHRRDVEKLVSSLLARVWSADSDFRDEALAAAVVGLWEAYERYDAERSTSFWGYAYTIVKGRVQDLMRNTDPLSRRARDIVRTEGDEALAPWHLRQRESVDDHVSHLVSDRNPEQSLALEESSIRVDEVLDLLRPTQAMVIHRVAVRGEQCKTIAADLGVSECRVSQIYNDGLAKLRRWVCPCGAVAASGTCSDCGSQLTRVAPAQHRRQAPGGGRLVTLGGESATLQEWARRRGLSYATVSQRMANGWSLELALSAPPGSRPRKSTLRAA
jgi:RNA polymerase sigma factor (sigma-70 family)